MGSKAPLRPSRYTIEMALNEVARYEGIYVGDNYVIKDQGNHVLLMIDADNGKQHVSYNLYFDENGTFTHFEPHRNN